MAYTLNPSVTLPYDQGTQFVPNSSEGIVNYNSGSIVMDASATVAATVPCGFKPRKIRVLDITALNATNGSEFEVLDQMPAGTTLKTVSGTKSLDTTGLIEINSGSATQGDNRSFTISAAALTPSHTYVFEAWA